MDDYDMEESVNRDRLSELPDSLIHHILSFLPLCRVVWTTLLSKRWYNLWTTAPCLNFCDEVANDVDEDRVRKYYTRALLYWRGTKILKFIIHLRDYPVTPLAVDIDLWVRFAVLNDVEELNINLKYNDDAWEDPVMDSASQDVYRVPQRLNSCSSLRQLSLVGCNLRIQHPPLWNQLKSLKIDGLCLGECLVSRILLGCPQLEVFELRLLESNENLNIQSTSLKVLKIEKYKIFYDEGPPNTELRICCANLETLEISGVLYCNCLLANISSLTDVTIGLFCGDYDGSWDETLGGTLRQIFSTIQHVKRVTLSSCCVQVLGALQKRCLLSPLSNVKSLKLNMVDIVALRDIMDFFGIFPNLKMLVFEDLSARQFNANNHLEYGTNFSKSFLMQLKTIVISSCFFSDPSILWIVEYLLKHAGTLEKFVLLNKGPNFSLQPGWCLLHEAQTLLKMPRASPTAQVIYSTARNLQKKYCCVCRRR